MQTGWFTTFRSSLLSILLHTVVIFLLIASFSYSPAPTPVSAKKKINIVQATQIDQKQIEEELNRLKKEDKDKKEAEQKRIEELEKKAEDAKKKAERAEKKRVEEEKKLIAAKKKKELELQKRELEQKKIEKIKKETEELERKKQIEEKKIEADRKKKEQEKLKTEGEKKKKEVAAKKKEEEKKLQAALAAEEAGAQEQADASLIENIAAEIKAKVSSYFNKVGLPENLKSKLRVKLLPNGEVIDVSVAVSSGHDIFDRRAVNAVQKASPLPVPDDLETFERLDLRDITFTFTP